MKLNLLGLHKTSSRSELASGELKPILSGGEVSVDTSTTEKLVLAGRNSSDEAGILRKLSQPSKQEIWQFLVFNLGGIAFFVVGYGVFALLYGLWGWKWWAAKIIADLTGWTVNYLIQRYWAFKRESQEIRESVIIRRFTLISLANVPIDYAIVGILNWIGVSPFIGLWVSSLFFTIWKFVWYKLWVFRKPKKV